MKKSSTHFSFLCSALLVSVSLFSQPCSVQLTGGNCLGTTLTFSASDPLSSVKWKHYGGVIYVADTITNSESVSIVAGGRGNGPAANQLGLPSGGIAIDGVGNLYIADTRNNRIQKWAPGATSGTTAAGGYGAGSNNTQLNYPKDVFLDTAGNIYVADYGNNRIQKFAPGSRVGTTVAGGNGIGNASKQLYGPTGLYVDNDGYIYIADAHNYRIQKWAPGATKGTTVGGGGYGTGSTQFLLPVDVYLDAAKNVYVADAGISLPLHHRIRKWIKHTRIFETIAGGSGQSDSLHHFNKITQLFVDKKRNVYVADAGNRRITKWVPGATSGVTVAGGYGVGYNLNQVYYATGVCLGPDSNIYVMDGANYAVKKFIPTNGIVKNVLTPKLGGVYSVEATFKNGCTAVSNPKTVYVKPNPQIQITPGSNRGNLCLGEVDTFYVYPWDEISTYNWIVPNNCTVLADLEDTIVIQVPANFNFGKLINVGTNVCGVGIPDTMALLGIPLAPSPLRGPSYVHPFETNLTYSVDDKGFSYNWSVLPAGVTIVSGQGSSSIVVNWGTQNNGVITVEATNSCGTSKIKQKYIYALPNKPLPKQLYGEERLITKNLTIYPVPTTSVATISYEAAELGRYMLELMDFSGRIVMKNYVQFKQGLNTFSVEMGKYSKGIYTVVLTNEKYEHVFGKIVK